MKTLLSFVIPCYRSEETIERVINEIISVVSEREDYDYEIICVNDCSPDNVYEVLTSLCAADKKIKAINFAKNMGSHAAILAGFKYANGDYIINLDDDMQCPVPELWHLLDPIINDECDVTTANYYVKKQALWKNIGSSINNTVSSRLIGKPKHLHYENFAAAKRFVIKEIIKYDKPYPYLDGLIFRTTKRVKSVMMEERKRGDNKTTGYSFKKSFTLFVNQLTSFSVVPLRFFTVIGTIAALIGFITGVFMIIQKIVDPSVPIGYTSTVVIQLFMGGLILFGIGLLGEYVGRIYISINKAPQYVIKDTINIENRTDNPTRDVNISKVEPV
ncbi:MAG: glycosyltransferase family 2 protein [Sphaerochaetaceae bacterium]|nr:glycosyltransferase family 2 protein [Sphaerochaetaceae bacterium]